MAVGGFPKTTWWTSKNKINNGRRNNTGKQKFM